MFKKKTFSLIIHPIFISLAFFWNKALIPNSIEIRILVLRYEYY